LLISLKKKICCYKKVAYEKRDRTHLVTEASSREIDCWTLSRPSTTTKRKGSKNCRIWAAAEHEFLTRPIVMPLLTETKDLKLQKVLITQQLSQQRGNVENLKLLQKAKLR
jgi:hypothetical protein